MPPPTAPHGGPQGVWVIAHVAYVRVQRYYYDLLKVKLCVESVTVSQTAYY